jgi:hypothetical protein
VTNLHRSVIQKCTQQKQRREKNRNLHTAMKFVTNVSLYMQDLDSCLHSELNFVRLRESNQNELNRRSLTYGYLESVQFAYNY